MDLRNVSKWLESFFQRLRFDFRREIANKNVIVFCQEKKLEFENYKSFFLWLVCSYGEELKWKQKRKLLFLFHISLFLPFFFFYRIKSWIFKYLWENLKWTFLRWIAAAFLSSLCIWMCDKTIIWKFQSSNSPRIIMSGSRFHLSPPSGHKKKLHKLFLLQPPGERER